MALTLTRASGIPPYAHRNRSPRIKITRLADHTRVRLPHACIIHECQAFFSNFLLVRNKQLTSVACYRLLLSQRLVLYGLVSDCKVNCSTSHGISLKYLMNQRCMVSRLLLIQMRVIPRCYIEMSVKYTESNQIEAYHTAVLHRLIIINLVTYCTCAAWLLIMHSITIRLQY